MAITRLTTAQTIEEAKAKVLETRAQTIEAAKARVLDTKVLPTTNINRVNLLKSLSAATITLTTAKAVVNVILKGTGTASINWGDGQINNYQLSTGANVTCTHSYGNSVVRKITISGATFTAIDCSKNELSDLVTTGNTSLEHIWCHTNKLTSLIVSGCTKLASITCYTNNLTTLNLSGLANLTTLDIYNNKLTSLANLSACTKLNVLWCNTNNLPSLNLSGFTNLTNLRCSENKLTSLTVNGCTRLTNIWCYNNSLTSLVVNSNNLTYLDCKNNSLSGTALNSLFASLPVVASGVTANLNIAGNPGATSASGCNTTTATNKRWIVDVNIVPVVHIAVTDIINVPTSAMAGTPLSLTGAVVAPTNATNKTITWIIYSAGTAGAILSGNTLSAQAAGTVTVRATIAKGVSPTVDFMKNFAIAVSVPHVAVTDINVSVPATIATGTDLSLVGTTDRVVPSNATNRNIEWRVAGGGETTGATIQNSSGIGKLSVKNAGTVVVQALIAKGISPTIDFTKNFEIKATNHWVTQRIGSNNDITIHYQTHTLPDTYNLLPQEYRIKVNDATNLPIISFNMIPGENREQTELYKIQVVIEVGHYYHPKSKTDLIDTLKKVNNTKYCDINFGGYKKVVFKWEKSFLSLLNANGGYVDEESKEISTPGDGFTINVICPLDYFILFRDSMIEGFTTPVGHIVFEVEGENAKIEEISIPLKLNIKKLAQMKISVDNVYDDDRSYVPFPIGATLLNRFNHALNIEGCLMTFLSKEGNKTIDAYYQIKEDNEFLVLTPDEPVKVSIGSKSIDTLRSQGKTWTDFTCEPYGVSLSEDIARSIMEKVMDNASNAIQEWTLEIYCPPLENWDLLDETEKEPFKSVDKVVVDVKTGFNISQTAILAKNSEPKKVKMSNTLSSIFKTQQINTRNYQYRQKTVYFTTETEWTEWKESENTSSSYLTVYPQKL